MSITLNSILESASSALDLSGCTCDEVHIWARDENGVDYADADQDLAGCVVFLSFAHDDDCPLVDRP
jgi:hypothetical protein